MYMHLKKCVYVCINKYICVPIPPSIINTRSSAPVGQGRAKVRGKTHNFIRNFIGELGFPYIF